MIDAGEIKSINDILEYFKKVKPVHYFRGQRDSTWPLLPSAYREGIGCDSISKEHIYSLESQRMAHFLLKAPAFQSNCPSGSEHGKWLALMQHYNVPTRLLDWTESPLCALFFATENNNGETDAVVYALDSIAWNRVALGGKEASLLHLESQHSSIIMEICKNAFSVTQKTNYYILAVTTSYTCTRMFVQMSQFTLHDALTPMDKVPNTKEALKKFIIPKDCINDIKNELFLLGIRRLTFFPDLDNLGKELANLKGSYYG